jgi:hypothetical protein
MRTRAAPIALRAIHTRGDCSDGKLLLLPLRGNECTSRETIANEMTTHANALLVRQN